MHYAFDFRKHSEALLPSVALTLEQAVVLGRETDMVSFSAKYCLPAVLLVAFCCSAEAATSLGSLTDSAGTPLVQSSNCTSTPCLQGVAYAAGYLSGCQVQASARLTVAACVTAQMVASA